MGYEVTSHNSIWFLEVTSHNPLGYGLCEVTYLCHDTFFRL